MAHQASTITIDDLYGHLTAYETRVITRQQAEMQQYGGSSANFAGRKGQYQQRGAGSSRGGRGAPRGGRARGSGRGHPGRSTGSDNNNQRPTCQICGKDGHSATRCWYRYEKKSNHPPTSLMPPTKLILIGSMTRGLLITSHVIWTA